MDPNVRAILVALGDGGTTEMAHRMHDWLNGGDAAEAGYQLGGDPLATGVPVDRIIGRVDIAAMLGRTRQAAAKVMRTNGFPKPFKVVDGTELYDRVHVQRWIDNNPDLAGTDA